MCIAAPTGRLGLRGAAARRSATSAPQPLRPRGRVTYEPYVMRNAIISNRGAISIFISKQCRTGLCYNRRDELGLNRLHDLLSCSKPLWTSSTPFRLRYSTLSLSRHRREPRIAYTILYQDQNRLILQSGRSTFSCAPVTCSNNIPSTLWGRMKDVPFLRILGGSPTPERDGLALMK